MITLRDYQQGTADQVYGAWSAGFQNVLVVLPTGGGKTIIFGHIVANEPGRTVVMAHRQELISQISGALALYGVDHMVVAPRKLQQYIHAAHAREHGRSYCKPTARVMVGSVQSILARVKRGGVGGDHIYQFLQSANLAVTDEFHHVLAGNSWGKAWDLLGPKCKGLGVTATPCRADGRGLGRWASGVVDYMVTGPTMRELIQRGYLSPYRIFAPPTAGLDLSVVPVGSGGDYVRDKMVKAVQESRIVGDVVGTYLKVTPGKLGVTFVPDIKTGEEMEAKFNASGVPCKLVHAKTPDAQRNDAVAALGRGDLKELVNVDIFGEGFDLPAIEVVSFARPTQSYGLYAQQFGRALRIMEGKQEAIILDHVENVMRHGLPDSPREWSLNDREKRSNGKPDGPPIRVCPQCTGVYESFLKDCPYCDYKHVAEPTRDIVQVEGDLTELDPAMLEMMRGEVARIDAPESGIRSKVAHAAGPLAGAGAAKRHRERQEAQAGLRGAIADWAGAHKFGFGRGDKEIYRRFYHGFGVDMLSAQAMGRRDAEALTLQIQKNTPSR